MGGKSLLPSGVWKSVNPLPFCPLFVLQHFFLSRWQSLLGVQYLKFWHSWDQSHSINFIWGKGIFISALNSSVFMQWCLSKGEKKCSGGGENGKVDKAPSPSKFSHACVLAKWLQSCSTLGHPLDCSLPGFSVHEILQARILEWVVTPSSRGSSQPRDWTCISSVSWFGRQVL